MVSRMPGETESASTFSSLGSFPRLPTWLDWLSAIFTSCWVLFTTHSPAAAGSLEARSLIYFFSSVSRCLGVSSVAGGLFNSFPYRGALSRLKRGARKELIAASGSHYLRLSKVGSDSIPPIK